MAEVRTGSDSLLQRLEENSLEVQHLGQTAKQRLHLEGETLRSETLKTGRRLIWLKVFPELYLVFTEEGLPLQRRQVDVEQTDQILTDTRTRLSLQTRFRAFNRHRKTFINRCHQIKQADDADTADRMKNWVSAK